MGTVSISRLEKLLEPGLYKPAEALDIKETSNQSNPYKTILLGFIAGFILSLFLVLIISSFQTSNEKDL